MSIFQDWITNELEDTELEALHRSPSVEYSFYNAVRAGDMEAVNKNCEEDSFLHLKGTGILSKNPLTNLKYHFVVTTAMLTRYCIDGGLESEQAYRLSDFYILKMDSCTTVRQIADLHHIMARDFTGKMILQKKSSILSRPVMQCVDYIYGHIKERITIQDLSEHTGPVSYTHLVEETHRPARPLFPKKFLLYSLPLLQLQRHPLMFSSHGSVSAFLCKKVHIQTETAVLHQKYQNNDILYKFLPCTLLFQACH